MKKLAEKEYWDSIYKNINSSSSPNKFSKFKEYIKFLTRDFSNFVMWEVLFQKYLPQKNNMKILEIGCAPGKYLINFHKMFGYDPYGVEYSEKGVEITKNNFYKNGLNPDNIINADFFDPGFVLKYENSLDLVFSRGFIEHYDDPKSVIGRHIDLLKKDGFIVISIPNLSGINSFLAKVLNKKTYLLHNVSIMKKSIFANLFDSEKIETIYCDYVGIFSFGLFNTDNKIKYYFYRILLLIQRPFDLVFRLFLRGNFLKSHYSSPYLLFIGRKK